MPYITQEARDRLEVTGIPKTVGELNYILTATINEFLAPDPGYADFNAVMGTLECVKQELYRRRIGPYEHGKMLENGDVYD